MQIKKPRNFQFRGFRLGIFYRLLPVLDQSFSRFTKIVKVKKAKAVKVGQTHAINARYVALNKIMNFLLSVNLYSRPSELDEVKV